MQQMLLRQKDWESQHAWPWQIKLFPLGFTFIFSLSDNAVRD